MRWRHRNPENLRFRGAIDRFLIASRRVPSASIIGLMGLVDQYLLNNITYKFRSDPMQNNPFKRIINI